MEGFGAGQTVNGFIYLSAVSGITRVQWDISWKTSGGSILTRAVGTGEDTVGATRDQIKLAFSSGNMTSGSMSLYGYPT